MELWFDTAARRTSPDWPAVVLVCTVLEPGLVVSMKHSLREHSPATVAALMLD